MFTPQFFLYMKNVFMPSSSIKICFMQDLVVLQYKDLQSLHLELKVLLEFSPKIINQICHSLILLRYHEWPPIAK